MPSVRYIKKHIDDILIVSTLAKIAYSNIDLLNEKEALILKSLKRAVPELNDKNLDEIGELIQGMNDDQLLGLTNNVKGILHEVQFVEIENEDGDNIQASIFTDTNHKDTDILLTDTISGESTEIQLKATDDSSYVDDWIENHEDGEILVTEEIADKMGLETSGLSNSELTVDVNDFVKKLIELDNNDSLWDYIPGLPAISIAIASYELILLYKKNLISFEVLKTKFIRLTGIKVAKFTIIAGLMMIPVINVVIGSALLYNLLYGAGTIANRRLS
jgi:hypothetical protein